jgi:cell division protein FtsQ
MWHEPRALNRIADLLLLLGLALALYGALHRVIHLPHFQLREIRLVSSPSHVSAVEVEELVRRSVRGNFFTLELSAVRAAFEELPWVRSADLRRRWPDGLEVALEEHVPLARWGDRGLVSVRGEIFGAAYAGPLPLFIGPDGSAGEIAVQYEHFRRRLEPLGFRLAQVRVSERRAWQIQLEDGPTLELGRDQLEARLNRFVANYDRTIARLGRRIEHVDLRYPNGFAVRIPELRSERTRPGTGRSAVRKGVERT